MMTTVAGRFPLPSVVTLTSRTGELHRLMSTSVFLGNPLAVTVTSEPGVAWSGLTVTDGPDVAVPVGQVAAAEVVDVVDPLVVVVDPPPVVVVDPAAVVVVLAGAPKPTSS